MVELLRKQITDIRKPEKLSTDISKVKRRLRLSKKKSYTVSQRDILLKNALKMEQLEKLCRVIFKLNLRIDKLIADKLPIGKDSFASVFITDHNNVYVFCHGYEILKFADIKDIINLMGMEAEAYLPPHADKNYFVDFGYKEFQKYYPGRRNVDIKETAFYQTLAPYSPALVRINKINGTINQYNPATKKWQNAIGYSYLRLKVK